MATTHQMEVDMKNDLPAAVVDVHDQAITAVGNATLARQPISYKGEARSHTVSSGSMSRRVGTCHFGMMRRWTGVRG